MILSILTKQKCSLEFKALVRADYYVNNSIRVTMWTNNIFCVKDATLVGQAINNRGSNNKTCTKYNQTKHRLHTSSMHWLPIATKSLHA